MDHQERITAGFWSDESVPPAIESEGSDGRGNQATAILALAAALSQTACGGSDSGGMQVVGGAPAPTPSASVTSQEASRFLAQASMGATKATIADVAARGYEAWLNDQFAMVRTTSHWDWLVANGFNVTANINNSAGFDATMWRQMISEPGQLRQRVGMALLDMLVVGIDGLTLNWDQFSMAAYVDLLLDNAFGNFRTLIGAITTNAAMGMYLTFLGNRRANAATGAVPDENYARELMQLFTIGLYQLNMDGSLVGGSTPVETYSQTDVTQLARVFTGLNLDSSDRTTPDVFRRPLTINMNQHETGASTVLGVTISGSDGMARVNQALDAIFAHSNVPPFVSRQLIQRLVTSNPSPGYIQRVASIFANDGTGVRGNLQAVIRAILLDSEARSATSLSSSSSGKLREPVLRLTGWARAFNVTSASGEWGIGDTSSSTTRLGQSKGRAPSVFNFYRPGYAPPNTAISSAGMVAPEFQVANELSVVAYVNFMATLIASGIRDVRADYSDISAKAVDSAALVDEVNLLLAAGQLSAATVSAIRAAVESISLTSTGGPQNRVNTAILLAMASPDYLVVR